MSADGNNTQLNVDIGATGSYKSIVSTAIKDFSNFWKSASGGNDAQGAASSFEQLASKLGLTTSKAQLVGGVLAGAVTAAVIDLGAKAVKSAADFQQMTTTLTTTAGVSEQNMGKMRDGILAISSSTGTAVDQVSQAMYNLASVGFNQVQGAKNGLEVLKAAAEGAKTENADLGTVSKAVGAIMVDYHLNANQAADATSKLVAAVGAGGATFQEFSGALHSVLPIASAAGVSMNDVLGSVASMTQHEMSADQATQDLAHSIEKMQVPTTGMTNELAALGIKSSDLNDMLSSKGLSGTLNTISQAILDKMGPANKVLLDSFNGNKIQAEDMIKMLAAMPPKLQDMAKAYTDGSMSLGDYRKAEKGLPSDQANLMAQYVSLSNRAHGFAQALKSGINTSQSYSQALQAATGDSTTLTTALMLTGENATNTTAAVNAVSKAHAEAGGHVKGWSDVQKNLNQQLSEAKNSLHNVSIGIGMGLLPAVTMVAKAFASVLQPLAEFVSGHQQMAAIVITVIGGLGALVATVLMVQGAFNKVKDAYDAVGTVFSKGWDITKTVANFLAMRAKAIAAAAESAGAWVDAARDNTIAWMKSAATQVGTWIATAARSVASAAVAAGAWIAGAAAAATAWIIANAAMLLGIGLLIAAVALIITHWNDIKQWISDFVNWVKQHWMLLVEILLAPIAPVLAVFLRFHDQIIHAFMDVINWIKGAFSSAGSWLVDAGRNIIDGLINGITGSAGKVFDTVKNIGSKAVSALKGVLKIFSPSQVFADIGNNIGLGLVQGMQGTQSSVQQASIGLGNTAIVNANSTMAQPNVTNNNSSQSSNSSINVQQLVIQAPNGATMQSIFQSLNQDAINTSRGLTPVQGRY